MIIFNVDFVAIEDSSRGTTRLDSLLSLAGLALDTQCTLVNPRKGSMFRLEEALTSAKEL